jgi:asparagine synthase (glutamine-hydrolysing)
MRGLYCLSAEFLERLPPALVARAYALARGSGPRFAAIGDKLRKFVRMSKATTEFGAYEAAISEWSRRQVASIVGDQMSVRGEALAAYRSVQTQDARDRFMHFDMVRYLPGDLLVKVDRASMAVSLEAREPFLDHETAKLAAVLGMQWKVRGGENKYILRRLLSRYFPRELFERPKQGFSAPIGDWLRGPLRGVLLEELASGRVDRWGMLDSDVVNTAVKQFLRNQSGSGSAAGIWILLQLQRWADRWLPTT